jgi:hypothetical protein
MRKVALQAFMHPCRCTVCDTPMGDSLFAIFFCLCGPIRGVDEDEHTTHIAYPYSILFSSHVRCLKDDIIICIHSCR